MDRVQGNLDPTTVDGRFTVAKAIGAFANRDPLVAAKWLGGHAVIVIGLEPDNLAGAPEVDPADLYNNINQLLAQPAPAWDPSPVTYRGQHVLVITVDPPRQGDPIACIGKNSGNAVDGTIYVRKQGASVKATAADIRRLSARLSNAEKTINGISVQAQPDTTIHVIDYPDGWLEEWLADEERRLLAPLDPAPATRPATDAELKATGISKKMLADYAAQAEKASSLMANVLGTVTHEETRTEEEYRAEVDDYLAQCRNGLTDAVDDLHRTLAAEITLSATNHTGQNYTQTLVELHVQGDVYGYDDDAEFTNLADYLPKPPRTWGPWTENRALAGIRAPILPALYANRDSDRMLRAIERGPQPTISNDGSVNVTCVPLHLYPDSTAELVTLRLIGKAPITEPVSVTWTATAANVNGKTEGSFTIPAHAKTLDVSHLLRHDA